MLIVVYKVSKMSVFFSWFQCQMENTTVYDGKSGVIQATAKLVIKNFLEVMSGFKPGRSFDSVPFMVGDTPMTLEVYPNGHHDWCKGSVSILIRNKGEADISVKYQLITDVETYENDYRDLEVGDSCGVKKFATHEKCAGAYSDKDFVVTAKVETLGENVMLTHSTAATKKRKLNVLENAYKKMQMPDFVFVFDGMDVPCHNSWEKVRT